MSAEEFLADLTRQGFHLAVEGENLRVTPASRLTGWLRQRIRSHKPALLALVRGPGWTAEDLAWIADAITADQGVPCEMIPPP